MVLTLNVERAVREQQFVLVLRILSVDHRCVDQNVQPIQNVQQIWPVIIFVAKILALAHVAQMQFVMLFIIKSLANVLTVIREMLIPHAISYNVRSSLKVLQ